MGLTMKVAFGGVLLIGICMTLTEGAYKLQSFPETNYRGKAVVIQENQKKGRHTIGFPVKSFKWTASRLSIDKGGDSCCLRMCDNTREVGHLCGANKDVSNTQKAFDKVILDCGEAFHNTGCDGVRKTTPRPRPPPQIQPESVQQSPVGTAEAPNRPGLFNFFGQSPSATTEAPKMPGLFNFFGQSPSATTEAPKMRGLFNFFG